MDEYYFVWIRGLDSRPRPQIWDADPFSGPEWKFWHVMARPCSGHKNAWDGTGSHHGALSRASWRGRAGLKLAAKTKGYPSRAPVSFSGKLGPPSQAEQPSTLTNALITTKSADALRTNYCLAWQIPDFRRSVPRVA